MAWLAVEAAVEAVGVVEVVVVVMAAGSGHGGGGGRPWSREGDMASPSWTCGRRVAPYSRPWRGPWTAAPAMR